MAGAGRAAPLKFRYGRSRPTLPQNEKNVFRLAPILKNRVSSGANFENNTLADRHTFANVLVAQDPTRSECVLPTCQVETTCMSDFPSSLCTDNPQAQTKLPRTCLCTASTPDCLRAFVHDSRCAICARSAQRAEQIRDSCTCVGTATINVQVYMHA